MVPHTAEKDATAATKAMSNAWCEEMVTGSYVRKCGVSKEGKGQPIGKRAENTRSA